MRRRWASLRDDPGWGASSAAAPVASGSAGRRVALEAIRRGFLRRERYLNCPNPACQGLIVSSMRVLERHGGSGTRLVLRCTREPSEHEVTLTMDPYTPEEVEQMKSKLIRGESPSCVRCGSELSLGSTEGPNAWGKSVGSQAAYHCPWCGVKWVPPVDLKRRAG